MNIERHFLIRYGLHHFVTSALTRGKQVFFIKNRESQNMIRHAKNLIIGRFGETAEIKMV